MTVLPLLAPMVMFHALVLGPLLYHRPGGFYIGGVLLVTLLWSFYYLEKTGRPHWWTGFLFTITYALFFSWQGYYSLLTVRRRIGGRDEHVDARPPLLAPVPGGAPGRWTKPCSTGCPFRPSRFPTRPRGCISFSSYACWSPGGSRPRSSSASCCGRRSRHGAPRFHIASSPWRTRGCRRRPTRCRRSVSRNSSRAQGRGLHADQPQGCRGARARRAAGAPQGRARDVRPCAEDLLLRDALGCSARRGGMP
jgi:hypothetical protein